MDLKITKTLVIPSKEIKWRFSRSSGPGGQNVNKIESRVEIIFNLEDSKVLNDYQKEILKRNLKNKLVNNSLRLAVQEHRNQLLNRQLALMKFSSIIKNALNKPFKLRQSTQPTKASQKKRVEVKKKRGELKKSRQKEKTYQILIN
ncbi:alternative ribosome rescue aminoacyl-tRNA hydrolase ArfB [uncultured Prochlorococcus sp.]|uniref:alternative ribosome rescue aminoacyl-tRNA hydrolase ArfB n=1 Tax=uncultured Prochlorococcus sp. TaxID=159733 RepID=UPI00258CD3E0|nr:alternative ribosome rescue aminoacyl-tRNA hydrolase ArfB [uncultured Prochlorococcus sp.]